MPAAGEIVEHQIHEGVTVEVWPYGGKSCMVRGYVYKDILRSKLVVRRSVSWSSLGSVSPAEARAFAAAINAAAAWAETAELEVVNVENSQG